MRNIFIKYFASSYANAFFQLIIGLIGVFFFVQFYCGMKIWGHGVHVCVFPSVFFWYIIIILF
jgi:hypothetical protein